MRWTGGRTDERAAQEEEESRRARAGEPPRLDSSQRKHFLKFNNTSTQPTYRPNTHPIPRNVFIVEGNPIYSGHSGR